MASPPLLVLLGAMVAIPACAEQGEGARSAAATPGNPSRSAAGAERDEVMGHAQKALEELKAAGDELARRAEKATGEAKARLERQLQSLRGEQKQFEARLQELKAATTQQWRQLKDELDRALQQFKRSDQKAQREAI